MLHVVSGQRLSGHKMSLVQGYEAKLWHQKLGHLNLGSMHKIIYEKAIVELLELKIVEGKICGDCHIGKQVKKWHKMVQHLTTS